MGNGNGRDLLAELQAAIPEKAIAHIVYANGDGKASERDIVPSYTYTLIDRDSGERFDYVIAGCFKVNDFRTFQTDRMEALDWTAKVWTNGIELLFPQKNYLAGKDPKVVKNLTEEGLKALTESGNWGSEPKHLERFVKRPLFVADTIGNAS